jgi:branched-chain amino acid transport system permease protein
VILNLILSALSLGSFYFVLSAGLSLVFGVMDVLNFASAGFFLVGLYVGWSLTAHGFPFVGSLAGGTVAAATLAALTERAVLGPLKGNPLGQILTTLGVMLILGESVNWVFGPEIQQDPLTGILARSVSIGGQPFLVYRLFLIAMGLAIWLALTLLLTRTRLGLLVRAGVEDRTLVELAGIRVRPLFTVVYTLGGALAGLAGVLYGPFGGVYPTAGIDTLLLTFIVTVIGGLGSISGTLLASVLVGCSEAFVGFYLPNFALAVNVLVMVLVLLLRPAGLLGRVRTRVDTHAA